MDDWETAQQSHRHVHNRVAKEGKSSRKGGAFDARKTFGTYAVECRSYSRSSEENKLQPNVEIYGFTDDNLGISAKLVLPGTLDATVILAASRKSLAQVLMSLTAADGEGAEETDTGSSGEGAAPEEEDSDASVQEENEAVQDRKQRDRIATFEKNSFRSPKFWMKWQGDVRKTSKDSQEVQASRETNGGYIVFTPDVSKFTGTITCDKLGWKNASISGKKLKTSSERDVTIDWIVG